MKDSCPLISVIVPVYKVEAYLSECVDSIINQTYQNLEIILVDDGSPDNCPNLCDEYQIKDHRVRVIHQANQGLSAARNSGLKIATGEYIAFVDSDDSINLTTYEKMMIAQKNTNADMVTCGICAYEDGTCPKPSKEIGVQELTVNDTLKTYLYDNSKVAVVAWNKLYKAEKFGEILHFEEGRLFEDFIPITKCLLNSSVTAVVQEELYYYRQRENSINTANFNVKQFNVKVMDLSYSVDTVIDILTEKKRELLGDIMPACLKAKLSVVNQMLCADALDKVYAENLKQSCKQYRMEIRYCTRLKKADKIKLLLFQHFSLYRIVYHLMKG